ncbi:MAG TPA: NADH-quinone oxidoreductase subunit C [Chthoniobacterales bacterium]
MSHLVDVVTALEAEFGAAILKKAEFRGEVTLVFEGKSLKPALKLAKEKLGFNFLLDISSVDNFGDEPRFEVVYELYSLANGTHLRLKRTVSEDHLEVPTVSDLWPTADWHEREVFDMMGISFSDHPDLRRILMWDGYPYFPLRKDFPLAGRPSEMPEVAFTKPAPLNGGPFVTSPSSATVKDREPRSKEIE